MALKRAILTFGVGPHAELLEIAMPSFEAFADRHGWDLIVPGGIECDRPPSWWKVPALIQTLDAGYDEALWIGADCVIVDASDDLTAPADAWQALVIHDTPADGWVPNADVWMVRPPMRPILEQMWSMTQHIDSGWWEQSALVQLMGWDVGTRPIRRLAETSLYRHTHVLEPGWNVHRNDQQEVARPRVMHATMWPDRASVMRGWAAQAVAA